jgi:chromosome segregation ATPase
MDIFDQLHHKLDRAIAAKARQSKVNDALRGDLAEVNREVERLKRMCNDLREATTPMTREIEFLEKSLEDTCKDLENANRDKKELEARNGALSNEIYQLQHMLDSVREQKDHTISTQANKLAELTRSLAAAQKELQEAKARFSSEAAELRRELGEEKHAHSDETAMVNDLTRQLTVSHQDAADARTKAEIQREEFKTKIEELKHRLSVAVTRAEDEER